MIEYVGIANQGAANSGLFSAQTLSDNWVYAAAGLVGLFLVMFVFLRRGPT